MPKKALTRLNVHLDEGLKMETSSKDWFLSTSEDYDQGSML